MVNTEPRSIDTGDNIIGFISPSVAKKAEEHKFFYGTTSRLVAGTGENIRGLLDNPSDSGKVATIVTLVGTVGPNTIVEGQLFDTPDTGLPAAGANSFVMDPNRSSPASPQLTLAADTNATALDHSSDDPIGEIMLHQGRHNIELTAPVILPPGKSLGINIPLGLELSGDGGFAVYWYEEDI